MRAGRMREQIVIQSVSEARTSTGAIDPTWSTFATVRCAVKPLVGREYFAAQAVNTANQVEFRIRYLSGVTTKMRISHDSKIYDIQSVIDIRDIHRELVLMGVEYVE